MKQKRNIIITEVEEDGKTTNVELTKSFIDFYKKETGHSSVTKKGITRFLNHLVSLYYDR